MKVANKNIRKELKNMSEKIIQLNEEVVKGELKELVRKSVEETLNELLDKEADELIGKRTEHSRFGAHTPPDFRETVNCEEIHRWA